MTQTRCRLLLAAVVCFSVIAPSVVLGQDFTFTKIVDTDTPAIPGGA